MRTILVGLCFSLAACATSNHPTSTPRHHMASLGAGASNVNGTQTAKYDQHVFPATSIVNAAIVKEAAQTVCAETSQVPHNTYKTYYNCVTSFPLTILVEDPQSHVTNTYQGISHYVISGYPSPYNLADPSSSRASTEVGLINKENLDSARKRLQYISQGCMGSDVRVTVSNNELKIDGANGQFLGDNLCAAKRVLMKLKDHVALYYQKTRNFIGESQSSAQSGVHHGSRVVRHRLAELRKVMDDTYTSIDQWQQQCREESANLLNQMAASIRP